MYRNLDLDRSSDINERSAICRENARTGLELVPFVPKTVEEAESVMRRLVVEYLEPPRIGS